MSTNKQPSLAIIIFAFNESENVRPILEELSRWLDVHEPDSEIVFVDDGSKDDTLAVARNVLLESGKTRRAVCLRHPTNRGIGAALKTGVAACTADWVTFLPADGQIEPEAIATLRTAAAPGDVDVVFSVYDDRNDGLDRKLLSFGVRALITLIHGVRVRSDGPYLFRRELFDAEQLKPDTFFLNFEFPIRVRAAGLPQRTVPIRCRPRRAGFSKSTGLKRVAGVARDLLELRVRRARGL
ncbi:MAG: glycosyltransferase family 2 protein [Myxococcales bacterium]